MSPGPAESPESTESTPVHTEPAEAEASEAAPTPTSGPEAVATESAPTDATDATDATGDDDEAQPPPPKRAKSQEGEATNGPKPRERPADLAKFWQAVEDDPADFTGWTYLLQFVDANAQLEEAREAYDGFLLKYPYCYGYWKKYADYEKRQGHPQACMAVFERGMVAIPLSADLWIHYLNYVKVERSADPEFVRAQFERAVSACGREWRSDKLWDNYVKWEIEGEHLFRVMALYDRILANPTQGLSHQFEMFKDFVKAHVPSDLLEVEAFLTARKEVLEALQPAKSEIDDDTESPDPPPPVSQDDENQAMLEKIIFLRKQIYKATEEKSQTRWKFEEQVKRPYFHMKPLERGQLKNWREYLDHEIKEQRKEGGDESEVVILFERCLIACALYEEFWVKYALWLSERKGDFTPQIRDVFRRAITHHLPSKIDIHVQFAAFEEKHKEYENALEVLEKIQKQHPNMLSLTLRRINLERRRTNYEAVHRLYQASIDKFRPPTKSDLAIKYSRFLRLTLNDYAKAKEVIEQTIETDGKNPKLFLQILDILLHEQPMNVEAITAHFDRALDKVTHPKHQTLFSQRKVEFLEDFGTDIEVLQAAQAAHSALSKQIRETQAKADETQPREEDTGSAIKTIEGRGGARSNGTTTYPAANSAAYSAQQNSQYQQYGARYNSQYGQYGSQYSNYYQEQGGGYGAAGSYYGGGYPQ
eukprot:snap_masked-scaffold580_size130538-processed-gene-0.16 protein:Tk07494 transcript:snap_masked-scaffold580_size130538-processed-gene-0.16-mRNA-1 annotation:"pre-mrna-processing factor 39"